ncbi:GntR family transcriptional regulator [Enterobacterales bacterium CwR94]|nr:GntR family transcriptional regulator [Enterobacterales bacterium CwR94]
MPKNDNLTGPFDLRALPLDRQQPRQLSEQIRLGITAAITEGRLLPGSRVPSCRDLAVQLGVARGTVRLAYDMLAESQLLVARGAAGTYVARRPHTAPVPATRLNIATPLSDVVYDFDAPPLTFQMGVPANDVFPAKVWARILSREARAMVSAPVSYPDPRGSVILREALVGYLAMTRGLHCDVSQVFITNGYAGALGITLMSLGLYGTQGWMEDPGYLIAEKALRLAKVDIVAVPVDEQGLQVEAGIALAENAAFALVTAGQQAPLGTTLSLARRHALLEWANRGQRWIIEDDYLGELQLQGRAAPALASLDTEGRVIHIGTFSKTLSPTLRLGYMVVPPALAASFGDNIAALAPASAFVLHNAVAAFMKEGHFLRHLRRMKRVYAERLAMMLQSLSVHFAQVQQSGLAVIVRLPDDSDDRAIAREALAWGMAPSPLSLWYKQASGQKGLLLGVTNMPPNGFDRCADQLKALCDRYA